VRTVKSIPLMATGGRQKKKEAVPGEPKVNKCRIQGGGKDVRGIRIELENLELSTRGEIRSWLVVSAGRPRWVHEIEKGEGRKGG